MTLYKSGDKVRLLRDHPAQRLGAFKGDKFTLDTKYNDVAGFQGWFMLELNRSYFFREEWFELVKREPKPTSGFSKFIREKGY